MAAPLLAAIPTVGRFAMQYLPTIMGVGAALPALRQGKPVEAALQGGLGYLSGMPLKGIARGVSSAAMKAAPTVAGRLMPNLVDAPGFKTAAVQAARGGVGLLSGVGALALGQAQGRAGMGQAGLPGQGLVQQGMGQLATPRPGEVDYSGEALPPAMGQYGPTSPYGGAGEILFGGGLDQRLQYLKDVEAARDAMRLLNPEISKAAEFRSKQELARQMAAAGIRQNIATRAQMLQNAQLAGLGMGATAAQQAGGALTAQYQYQ
jgi:hypothetical protein